MYRQQLDAYLLTDGEVIDYRQLDAQHYVVYDLQPLLQAALTARCNNEDWCHLRNDKGASLATAVAWLQPYASEQRYHRECVHSHVRFDTERAKAGLPGFSGLFDPPRAAIVNWLALTWDPAFTSLARALHSRPFLDTCPQ